MHQGAIGWREQIQLLLREVTQHQALAFGDVAGKRREVMRNGLDKRGLALAIGAQDADALTRQHRTVDTAHHEPPVLGGRVARCVDLAICRDGVPAA